MSETYSQAAKRLLAGLDAKAKKRSSCDVFVLPQTQGGRWLLKRTIAFGGYVDGTPLSTVDFDEEYRELKEDRDDYFYSIGQPVDEGA